MTEVNNPTVVTLTAQKPWYTSKTMLASIIGFIVTALGFVGVQIDPELQGTLLELASQLGALVAFAVAAWGRWTADSKLK